jgi:hypothetical protein
MVYLINEMKDHLGVDDGAPHRGAVANQWLKAHRHVAQVS